MATDARWAQPSCSSPPHHHRAPILTTVQSRLRLIVHTISFCPAVLRGPDRTRRGHHACSYDNTIQRDVHAQGRPRGRVIAGPWHGTASCRVGSEHQGAIKARAAGHGMSGGCAKVLPAPPQPPGTSRSPRQRARGRAPGGPAPAEGSPAHRSLLACTQNPYVQCRRQEKRVVAAEDKHGLV